MKQTSLLDSFVKKSIKPAIYKAPQEKSSEMKNQVLKDSQAKKDNFSMDKQSVSKDQNQKVQQITQKVGKMQIQYPQYKKIQIEEPYQFKRLKKTMSQVKSNKNNKVNENKTTSKKLRSRGDNSQNEFSIDQCDSQLQQQEQLQDYEQQFKKRRTTGVKKSIRKPQSTCSMKVQSHNNELHQQTMLVDRTKFSQSTPKWAIPGHALCRDKYGVSCKDDNYDQTTLFVPQEEVSQLTGAMKQYWQIKADNFDKVVFFKLGKFYQLFYQDALLCNQLLNLKWMGTKMHVGFPQKSLQRYTLQLVKSGLKIVVVQQMQTPQQMNERIKSDKQIGRKSEKTLKRQITQIITKGTIINPQKQQIYLPNYLISVYRYQDLIAYSLLQVGSNLILLGIVQGFQQFKTILYQTHPSQILYDPDNLPKDYVQIMKDNMDGMVFTKLINKSNLWHYLNAANQLNQLVDKNKITRPKILEQIDKLQISHKSLMISTLSGMFDYLHRLFKFQYVLMTAKFKFYQKEKALTHMILDSQALQHLQIFQTQNGPDGSLFGKIDRTKTKFGKRLFRRWMTSPLLNVYQINQRLDAVSDMRNMGNELQQIQKYFSKIPDLQKMSNRLYKYSVTKTSAASAVYFQDLHTNRLKQFDIFMSSLQQSLMIISLLANHEQSFRSTRLKTLISLDVKNQSLNEQKLIYFQDEEFEKKQQIKQNKVGLLPDIVQHLQEFKKYIVWQSNKPYPKQGVIKMFDQLLKKQKQVKRKLDRQLQIIRQELNCPNINYAHIKERFQIEIPQKKTIKIPDQYTFSSRKQGFSRYLVPEVRKIVQILQKVQKDVKVQMGIFVTFFFEQFKSKQNIWERYINILAQLDCFASMAQYSNQKKTTRPKFTDQGYQVTEAIHPALYSLDFVPNDISFKEPIIILTGPNMGGKSTTLRTVCLLAVMAQMGCYVPCKTYRAGIVDRIFTRIGASDKLQAGKSTFFIQMQQTKSVIKYATKNSLAIIDELGRGTATFDGMALAHSVLNYMINHIKCKCIFATHYHSLTQQFSNMKETCLKMMDYQIVNSAQDRICFLYKLVSGKAEKSFGLNVAQMVGLPKELIQEARLQSNEMNQQIQCKRRKIKVFQFVQHMLTNQN